MVRAADACVQAGHHRALTIFGILNIRTTQWSYILPQRMQANDFTLFLTYLLYVANPQQSIILIADNYSSHTAARVHSQVTDEPRLHLYYLPTHCTRLIRSKAFGTSSRTRWQPNGCTARWICYQTVFAFFRTITPAAALQWAGA